MGVCPKEKVAALNKKGSCPNNCHLTRRGPENDDLFSDSKFQTRRREVYGLSLKLKLSPKCEIRALLKNSIDSSLFFSLQLGISVRNNRSIDRSRNQSFVQIQITCTRRIRIQEDGLMSSLRLVVRLLKMKGACLNIEVGDAISRVRFAPRSNNLLISSWDSTLRLYDVDNSVLRSEFSLEASLLGCCFQDESTAFSIGSDFCLRRHDFESGICFQLGNHEDTATCVEYSEETCQAITAGLDKRIISWDMRMGSSSTYSKLVSGEVESMSLCGNHLIVAIGKSVNIYDLRNFEGPIQTIESCMDYRIRCVRSFSNLKGYAVGSVDGRVAVKYLNPSDANESYSFRCHPKSKDGKRHLVAVNDIVFHPSHNGAFVTGDDEGYASSWDAQSKKRRFQFLRYSSSLASLSYNCGGQLLAVASSYTYQEANETEEPPKIFIHEMDENQMGTPSCGTSKWGI